ncbi:hypothetical protein ACIA6T_34460 [Streptomyces sp. NPDC051740]|uniref:hypothetical protein n=1 Tax=Streptomyces sp. NPDC051740 TaxID=3365673 RepID=UPI0037A480DF
MPDRSHVQYACFDSDGRIAGTALFATAQQMVLSATSLQRSGPDPLVMPKSTGYLPPLAITWTTTCAPTRSPGNTTLWTKQPISWDPEVRCDDKLSITDTSGCAVPWTAPTLFVSRAEYGSSADMIEWTQQNLSGH